MAAPKATPEVQEAKEEFSLSQALRRVLLAGVGAALLTQEEIEKFVDKLVERGEIAEQEGKKMVREIRERRRAQARERAETVEEKAEEIGEGLESRIERVLARMNLPSRREIQALSQKLDELSEKLDRLTEAK